MSAHTGNNFIGRTLGRLGRAWRDLSHERGTKMPLNLNPSLDENDTEQLIEWMDACLTRVGGEVAARTRAATLGRSYLELNEEGRIGFLTILAERYDIKRDDVEHSFQRWYHATEAQQAAASQALRDTLNPPRMQLLKQFNELPEGVKFLVDMRAELLALKRSHPQLASLQVDLKRLLTNWFDIGLLQLEEINWQSSAELLEKLIAYEAVHAIQSWDDLKNRLDSDRRCFAFFHPNMPDEPLIFVEVALVQGLAESVQTLLDESAPLMDIHEADTAIFYSISNAQKGLAGISLGNFLIKRVVSQLQHEFPELKQFATLSPIPGFCDWLSTQNDQDLEGVPGGQQWLTLAEPRLASINTDETEKPLAKEALLKLACHYICQLKGKGIYAKNSVSHFHFSNGAQLKQINWQADMSDNGLKQSAGMMVNYLYDLPKIETRSQAYIDAGTTAVSSSLKHLLKL